jgi:hypothetical protein
MEYCVLVYDVRFGIKNKKAWICLKGTGMVKKRIELHHPSLLFIMGIVRKACDILFKTGGVWKDIPFWILSGFITSIVRESVRYLVLKIPSIFLGFWV